jgi:hypothetical protein
MIIADLIQPAVLTGFVREMPGPATYNLNQVLPDRQIGDIEAAIDVVLRTNRAASFRAYDAETPIGKRDQFQRSRVQLPPLGVKTVMGEQERLLLQQLQSGGFNDAPMVEMIYDEAATNTRAVLARMEVARGDVLVDGKVTIAENGLNLQADFGVDPSHFPTAATLWSDTAHASPMQDLHDWVNTYIDDVGEAPGYLRVSRQVLTYMLESAEIRQLLATIVGAPALVSLAQLQQVLDQYDLPQIVQYNTRIDVDGTTVRPIPTDVAILTPETPSDLGYTAWGVTAEALELAASTDPQLHLNIEDAPGLISLQIREGDPMRTWTKVAAVGLPIITDPRRLFTATVA